MHMLMHEIDEWHKRTFPDATIPVIVEKLREEVDELLADARAGNDCVAELADVFIVASVLARRVSSDPDFDITEAIREKMRVNHRRTWERTDDGHYERAR